MNSCGVPTVTLRKRVRCPSECPGTVSLLSEARTREATSDANARIVIAHIDGPKFDELAQFGMLKQFATPGSCAVSR